MPVKGFDVNSVEARRFTKQGEKMKNIRVDHNIALTTMSPVEDDAVSMEFRFTANYVGVGVIKIEGRVIWQGEAKDIIAQWSKNNQIPQELANQVYSAIISHCMPTAVLVARDIALPPPLPPLPPIQMKKKADSKDRRSSPEII